MKCAIVLGCNWTKLDVLEEFKLNDMPIIGVDRDKSVKKNVDKFINASIGLEDIEAVVYEYQNILHSYLIDQKIPHVFVDTEVGLPLAMRLDYESYRLFFQYKLLDKHFQYAFLKLNGLPIPDWKIATKKIQMRNAGLCEHPAIVKPRIGWAASSVSIFDAGKNYSNKYIVQKAVSGTILVVVIQITDDLYPDILGVLRHGITFGKYRPGCSMVSYPLTPSLTDIAYKCKNALSGYKGSLLIEVIVDKNEEPSILEVTPIMPNLIQRQVLGIDFCWSGLKNKTYFKKKSAANEVRAGCWLYPKGIGLDNEKIVKVIKFNPPKCNISFISSPSGTALVDYSGNNRAIGLAITSAKTQVGAIKLLRSLVRSSNILTQTGNILEVQAFGLRDIE